jgi:uncharacterized heparinase superfamily protein
MENWIAANPPGTWPSWHPYPTSLRIVNWIRAAPLPPAVAESLAMQVVFLERNLEFHLGGNHLLENARALLAAGCCFEGPAAERWKTTGLELLCRELRKQVLPDGGHCERSPYYHRRMRRLVADAIELLAAAGGKVPPEWPEAAARMETFERALRHQDGGLARFHDSLGDDDRRLPPSPELPRSFPHSGYCILDGPHGRLIADYGAPGAAANPGHQHAGIFSFEISCGSCRVVVDSGTETYELGPQRSRLRSTAAHNTVRVDGQDQFEVWGGFRVGRRAWVGQIHEHRGPNYGVISAAHDGYDRLGVEHRRSIVSIPGAGWLILDDLAGRGLHNLESFLHLGPGISAAVEEGRVELAPLGWNLLPFGLTKHPTVLSDYHSPSPGHNEPSETLLMAALRTLPCRCGYFLGPLPADRLTWDSPDRLRIESPLRSITVDLNDLNEGGCALAGSGL